MTCGVCKGTGCAVCHSAEAIVIAFTDVHGGKLTEDERRALHDAVSVDVGGKTCFNLDIGPTSRPEFLEVVKAFVVDALGFDGIPGMVPPATPPSVRHPLKNPASTHYEMPGGVESIDEMEKMFTRAELMAWAKITAMKYRLRIGNKDSVAKDAEKIADYEAYYYYLEGLRNDN